MSSSFRAASTVAVLLIAPSAILSAQNRVDGWTYTMNITTDSGAGHRSSMAMRHQVTANRYRMEVVQVSGLADANGAEGMYNILNDADTTMTMVMPAQRMATVTSLAGLPDIGKMRLTMKEHVTSRNVADLGAGETILGHPTHRYRITTAGTVDITIMGQSCTQRLDGTSDVWIAPDVDLAAPMLAALKHFNGAGGVLLDDQSESTLKMPFKGAALRTISRKTRVDESGKTLTVTTTTEYVELEHRQLDASLFAVPSDYHTMDMRAMMKTLPAGMLDSAMAAGVGHTGDAICKAAGGN